MISKKTVSYYEFSDILEASSDPNSLREVFKDFAPGSLHEVCFADLVLRKHGDEREALVEVCKDVLPEGVYTRIVKVWFRG